MAHGFDEVLMVELAGQRFGLPGGVVRELLRAVLITPVTHQGPLVEGVVSVRGKVLPVFDFRRWLSLPAKSLEPSDHFVVIWTGRREAVVRVDRALELARLEVGAIDTDQPDRDNAVTRVAQFAGGLVLLPDLNRFFAMAAEGTQP